MKKLLMLIVLLILLQPQMVFAKTIRVNPYKYVNWSTVQYVDSTVQYVESTSHAHISSQERLDEVYQNGYRHIGPSNYYVLSGNSRPLGHHLAGLRN